MPSPQDWRDAITGLSKTWADRLSSDPTCVTCQAPNDGMGAYMRVRLAPKVEFEMFVTAPIKADLISVQCSTLFPEGVLTPSEIARHTTIDGLKHWAELKFLDFRIAALEQAARPSDPEKLREIACLALAAQTGGSKYLYHLLQEKIGASTADIAQTHKLEHAVLLASDPDTGMLAAKRSVIPEVHREAFRIFKESLPNKSCEVWVKPYAWTGLPLHALIEPAFADPALVENIFANRNDARHLIVLTPDHEVLPAPTL